MAGLSANWKKLAASSVILLFVVAGVWYDSVASYESDLGTPNVVKVDLSDSVSDSQINNQLASLSFDDKAEDLSWASLEISLEVDGNSNVCSFGYHSNANHTGSKVSTTLSADGLTFTTEIDATDSESFTYFDIAQQDESNDSSYWMKFSSTDIYLSEGINWTFIQGAEFSEVKSLPDELSNETDNSLEWYEYDLSVHRVEPNEGVYVFEKNDLSFKLKFLTYYNSNDESRYPTMIIAALDGSSFPALENPNTVVSSPCKILIDDLDEEYWNANESIILLENGVNICQENCSLKLIIKYETVSVEIDSAEFEIVQ